MLRSISLYNFVHFLQPQRLRFEDGANFIIGPNSTGKSAILELIQRCLSNDINTTTSSIPNENELAYAVCHFAVSDNYPSFVNDIVKPKEIIACLFVEKSNEVTTSDDIREQKKEGKRYYCYKVICTITDDNSHHLFVQQYLGFYGCNAEELKLQASKQIKLDQLPVHTYNIISQPNVGEDNQPTVDEDIQELYRQIRRAFSSTEEQNCPDTIQVIFKWLEKRYVGVLPMRSIGPLQWTNSPDNKHDKRAENYMEACSRAEILTDLLNSEDIWKDKENEYHQYLVSPYKFLKTESGIVVYNEERTDASPKPLLKTPEGILEAKQLSLILAHKHYATITFEEPDRGMHPHMIKKMRDLVLRNITGKTVIIISHHPSIIDQWSMTRTFMCSKSTDCTDVRHYVCKIPSGYNRYGRIDEMKSLLFSPRILFVEGITDKIIFEAIFSLLINDQEIEKEKDISLKLKQYLLATDVLELSSATEGPSKRIFCKKLKKENFILYDFDQFTNPTVSKEKGKFRVNGEDIGVNYDVTFKNREAFMVPKNLSEFEIECEKENIFCWKTGAIEKRIIEVLDQCTDKAIIDSISVIVKLKPKDKSDTEATNEQEKKTRHENDETVKSNAVDRYLDFKTNGKMEKWIKEEKTIMRKLKHNLKYADSWLIEQVAKGLLHFSEEVDRFVRFLQRKSDADYKRKLNIRSDASTSERNFKKARVEYPETGLVMEVDIPDKNQTSDEEEASVSGTVHTGQTQNLLDLSL